MPMPGGRLTMLLIFINLSFFFFKKSLWKINKLGIIILHLGGMLLLIGGGLTAMFSSEGNIIIDEGTQANFIEDFKNQNRIILGGPRPATTKVRQFYTKLFPKTKIVKTGSTHAEMVKYFTNTFLATKVSFANEMKMLCDKLNIDYDKVVEYSTYDERLGKSHWAVPGPDGHNGFGGSCFPKDMNELLDLCRELGVSATTLFGAWQTNEKVRPERDWEQLKGRAVTDDTV